MSIYNKTVEIEKKLFEKEDHKILSSLKLDINDFYHLSRLVILKKIIINIIFEKKILSSEKNKETEIYYTNYIDTLKRQDHSESFKKVKFLLNKNFSILEDIIQGKKINSGFITDIFSILKKFFKYNQQLKNSFLSFYLSTLAVKNEKYLKFFEERLYGIKPKLVLTFCDALGEEYILTLAAKNLSIPTVTLQHGQYFNYLTDDKPIHRIVLENFNSGYMLCWGKFTVLQAKELVISEDRMKIVGNIKDVIEKETQDINLKKNEVIQEKKSEKIFGIILDNNSYIESNCEMIRIGNKFAQENGYKYLLRYHPANNKKNYENYINEKFLYMEDKNTSIEEYAEKVEFSISHISSVFVELLKYKSPCLIFKDKYSNVNWMSKDLEFENYEDLKEKLLNIKKIDYENKYEFYSKTGDVYKNYKKAFEEILWRKEM